MSARALFLFIFIWAAVASAEPPIVVIVRHAEKGANGDRDPDLSPAGKVRADTLAQMLKDSGIVAIFTTEFKRTVETAAPTARALGVNATVIPSDDQQQLVDKLRALKGNALVVGHGNTIPNVLKALGIETPIDFPESDYSELFVVTLADKPELLRLHYPRDFNCLSTPGG